MPRSGIGALSLARPDGGRGARHSRPAVGRTRRRARQKAGSFMRLIVLTLPFDAEGGFDAEALDAFSRELEVLEMSDHFFHIESRP